VVVGIGVAVGVGVGVAVAVGVAVGVGVAVAVGVAVGVGVGVAVAVGVAAGVAVSLGGSTIISTVSVATVSPSLTVTVNVRLVVDETVGAVNVGVAVSIPDMSTDWPPVCSHEYERVSSSSSLDPLASSSNSVPLSTDRSTPASAVGGVFGSCVERVPEEKLTVPSINSNLPVAVPAVKVVAPVRVVSPTSALISNVPGASLATAEPSLPV
jgi:hypothetical protein